MYDVNKQKAQQQETIQTLPQHRLQNKTRIYSYFLLMQANLCSCKNKHSLPVLHSCQLILCPTARCWPQMLAEMQFLSAL